ncbi:MAG: hypothetical protein WCF90_07500 [Methanomicrobiales archaeon]
MIVVGIGFISVIIAIIAVSTGDADSPLAGLMGRMLLVSSGIVYMGPDGIDYAFSAETILSLTLVRLVLLVLLFYLIYKLLVRKSVIVDRVWGNHDWDLQGGDFGPPTLGIGKCYRCKTGFI